MLMQCLADDVICHSARLDFNKISLISYLSCFPCFMLSSSLRRSHHEEQHNVNESAEVPSNCCWNLLFAKDSQSERSLKEIGTLKDKELKKACFRHYFKLESWKATLLESRTGKICSSKLLYQVSFKVLVANMLCLSVWNHDLFVISKSLATSTTIKLINAIFYTNK